MNFHGILHYRCKFYSSYNIQQISGTSLCFDLFLGFHEKEYLFRLSRRTMQSCDEETHNANATTADFDFLQESLAKVLTNQSAPFTKARFQNKNKRLRCIKVGNRPLKNVFKRLAASNLSFLTRTA